MHLILSVFENKNVETEINVFRPCFEIVAFCNCEPGMEVVVVARFWFVCWFVCFYER